MKNFDIWASKGDDKDWDGLLERSFNDRRWKL